MHAAVRTSLAYYLAALPALADVGASVHWRMAPQSASLPLVLLTLVSDLRLVNHQGANRWANAVIQVDAFATDAGASETLRDAVIDALHGFRGTIGFASFGPVLHAASREDDSFAPDRFRSSCDIQATYSPSDGNLFALNPIVATP
jgi:hypothetical protein